MNTSMSGSQPRQPEPQDVAAFTPSSIVRGMTKKTDALPVISVIVVIFVLLAVLIILAVRYGPQLRTVQITLRHEPLPQDLHNGVHLTHWKQLDPQGKLPGQPSRRELPGVALAGVSCQCSCKRHEANVIEITYL